jgi:hypothetical protein
VKVRVIQNVFTIFLSAIKAKPGTTGGTPACSKGKKKMHVIVQREMK